MSEVLSKARAAKKAAARLSVLDTATKNRALTAMAESLIEQQERILTANEADLSRARKEGISGALLDRLTLTRSRLAGMAQGLKEVAAAPDPVGEVVDGWVRPNGLKIERVRVPLGVVGIIYEARPNVTADAAGLCLKAGNAVILRGGSEAIESNKVIVEVLSEAASQAGLPPGCINLIEQTDRAAARELMTLSGYVDVLIPRGGAGLIRAVVENATVPVIETGVGNCHTYVDSRADLDRAARIVVNAKCDRPGVCNAMETLLLHRDIASSFLPRVAPMLFEQGVTLRGCEETCKLVPQAQPATEEDWETEYLDYILAVRIVSGLEEALEHIYRYGSRHSEAIVTEDYSRARVFLREVDAAAVYVNASTRFTDGGQFGMGAEIGISTQKLHARGPMGLRELTTTKFLVFGEGQIRE